MTRYQELSWRLFDALKPYGWMDEMVGDVVFVPIAYDVLRITPTTGDEKERSINLRIRYMKAGKDWDHRALTTHQLEDLIFRIQGMARKKAMAA